MRLSKVAVQNQTSTAIQLLLKYLEAEGVEYIFGIPGGPLMPLYEAIHDNGRIRHIISKHEGGGAFMADGYARVRGGLGVCCATTGPGATNALTGVACAHMDSTPLLLLTAQIALKAFGKGAAQESSVHGVDVVDLYKPVTKSSIMLLSGERMSETVRYALRTAMTGRPGPVHLNLPADQVKTVVPNEILAPREYRPQLHHFDREAVKEACALLARARKPAILAGNGVALSGAFPELRRLAEKLYAPVATTPKGKGVFTEDHLLSLGVFGFAGSPQADAALLSGEVDVLLVVGSSLGELSTHAWSAKLRPREALIHIDIDPREIGKNYPTTLGVVGDARTVLTEMLFQLNRETAWKEDDYISPRKQWVKRLKLETPRFVSIEGFSDKSIPLKPQRLIRELQDCIPLNALLFVDIGNVMAWALHFFSVTTPGSFIINLGLASMGHAIAAAIGGKLAAPHRPVISLVGDAAFAMNGMEVHAAVENNIPVIWLVMNNGGHGMVCHGERIQFKGKLSTGKFNQPLDIAGLAQSMGALAYRVDRPDQLAHVMEKALQADAPVVIDARIDPESMPPLAMRIETLDKFFNGDKPSH